MTASTPGVDIVRDVVYRSVDGKDLLVDLYVPEGGAPRGSVVFFHGGGWVEGSRDAYEQERQALLAATGFLVVSAQYRFVSDAPFPGFLEDARAAVAWVREHAGEYGASADRIGAWGASAGGTIAALLALGNPDTGHAPDVDAAVALFPPTSLAAMSGGNGLERMIFAEPTPVDQALGGVFDPEDASHRAMDPLSLVSADAAPLLLITGDRDRVINASDSERLFRALSERRAPAQLHVIAGLGHEDGFGTPSVLGLVGGFLEQYAGSTR